MMTQRSHHEDLTHTHTHTATVSCNMHAFVLCLESSVNIGFFRKKPSLQQLRKSATLIKNKKELPTVSICNLNPFTSESAAEYLQQFGKNKTQEEIGNREAF